jgi:hypothetical protein
MYSHTLFLPQQAIITTFPERMHYEAGVDCSDWSWGREHRVIPINLLLSCFCMALFGRMYHLRIVWFIHISLNKGLLSGFLASKDEYHTLQALKILYMCAKPKWKLQQLHSKRTGVSYTVVNRAYYALTETACLIQLFHRRGVDRIHG